MVQLNFDISGLEIIVDGGEETITYNTIEAYGHKHGKFWIKFSGQPFGFFNGYVEIHCDDLKQIGTLTYVYNRLKSFKNSKGSQIVTITAGNVSTTYVGFAPNLSQTSSPVWRIQKIVTDTTTNSVTSITWALDSSGKIGSDLIWNNYLTYQYA